MEGLINLFFGSAALGQAFSLNPEITSIKILFILLIFGVGIITIAIVNRKFGSKESPVTHNISYGQGGSAGPGGYAGDGGSVLHIEGFPIEAGPYQIKVGKGGAPGEHGEESSITTPSGTVLIVSGGQAAKEPNQPSTTR